MKLPNIKILDEVDKRLRKVSKEVTFPLSKEDKENVPRYDYLFNNESN